MQARPLRNGKSWALLFAVISIFVVIDQWTKFWARGYLIGREEHFLGGFLQLHLAENSGAFLSLGSTWDPRMRFVVFSAAVSLFLASVLWQLRIRRKWMEEWGLVLLLSGGIGNLIDRVYKGSVTDFLFIDLGFVHTGIFNVADMVIVASVILLLMPQKKVEAVN